MSRALKNGIAAVASVFGALVAAVPAARGADRPVVDTQEGPVRGFARNGVSEFLGIPYAAPPVGTLRWRPPEAVQPW